MADIQQIINGESGLSARTKINESFNRMNLSFLTNRRVINVLSDFPAPIDKGGGLKIYLEDGVQYMLNDSIETPYTLVAPAGYGGFRITSLGDALIQELVKTDAGPLLESENDEFGYGEFDSIVVSAPDSMLVDIKCNDPDAGAYFAFNSLFGFNCDRVGYVRDNLALDIHYAGFEDCSHGLTCQNTTSVFIGGSSWWKGWKNTVGSVKLTIEGTCGRFIMAGFELENQANEVSFDFKSTSVFEGVSITSGALTGPGSVFAVGSRDQKDPYIKASGNVGLSDSDTTIDATTPSDETTPLQELTIIPAINAKILVNKSDVIGYEPERLTTTASGVIEYFGLESISRKFNSTASIEPATATKSLEIGIVKINNSIEFSVTFDNITNIIVETGHARSNDDAISFLDSAGTLPTELRKDAIYYVVNAGVNNFQVSYTKGGSPIAFTNNGTPPNEYKLVEFHGIRGNASIGAGTPQTVRTTGRLTLNTGDKVALYLKNSSDAVDINTNTLQITI